jgi:hypothetical protein
LKAVFLARPFREGREAHHVGEQDSDLPAFRFHDARLWDKLQHSMGRVSADRTLSRAANGSDWHRLNARCPS